MTEEYDEPSAQQGLFYMISILAVIVYSAVYFIDTLPIPSVGDDSGSRAIVETCVEEKGPWNCLVAIGTALDDLTRIQSGTSGPAPDTSLVDAFPKVVPAEKLLDNCGRKPECISFMVGHGYDRKDVSEVLER